MLIMRFDCMLLVRACPTFLLLAALAVTPAVASRTHRAPTSGNHKASSKKVKHVSHAVQGQRGIDPDRAREIQTALIREKYMNGTPSGQWDESTEAAMLKYQADHGWQTKLTPDSRALIKLGLGPKDTSEAPRVGSENALDSTSNPSSNASNTLAATHSIAN
jgi:peptidoglycan hydrolase-like protein with peptidoglycan-binding domain